jgi:hypothetical protein
MKDKRRIIQFLPLTVGGTPIQAPDAIQRVNGKASPLGGNIFQLAIELLLITAVVLSLFFLVWGGIKWTMSGGDKNGIESARGTITYAIIGLAVSLAAFLIINVIGSLFGIDFLKIFSSK